MECVLNRKIKVMNSNAGYYLGTSGQDGFPFCRITDYYKKSKDAEKGLKNKDFKVRNCSENNYCNKDRGCLKEE